MLKFSQNFKNKNFVKEIKKHLKNILEIFYFWEKLIGYLIDICWNCLYIIVFEI
jgi:hypothetical protein